MCCALRNFYICAISCAFLWLAPPAQVCDLVTKQVNFTSATCVGIAPITVQLCAGSCPSMDQAQLYDPISKVTHKLESIYVNQSVGQCIMVSESVCITVSESVYVTASQ